MLATGIHTAGYLAITGLVAWVFYRKLGLAVLRKTWFNFNLVWGLRRWPWVCSLYLHNNDFWILYG